MQGPESVNRAFPLSADFLEIRGSSCPATPPASLRTTLDRPDLASSIQILRLLSFKSKWITPQQDIDWREEAPSFQDVTEKAISVIQRARFTDAEEWADVLKKGNFFAFAAILISQLANINTLHLDFCFVWLDGFPGRMMRNAVFFTKQRTANVQLSPRG